MHVVFYSDNKPTASELTSAVRAAEACEAKLTTAVGVDALHEALNEAGRSTDRRVLLMGSHVATTDGAAVLALTLSEEDSVLAQGPIGTNFLYDQHVDAGEVRDLESVEDVARAANWTPQLTTRLDAGLVAFIMPGDFSMLLRAPGYDAGAMDGSVRVAAQHLVDIVVAFAVPQGAVRVIPLVAAEKRAHPGESPHDEYFPLRTTTAYGRVHALVTAKLETVDGVATLEQAMRSVAPYVDEITLVVYNSPSTIARKDPEALAKADPELRRLVKGAQGAGDAATVERMMASYFARYEVHVDPHVFQEKDKVFDITGDIPAAFYRAAEHYARARGAEWVVEFPASVVMEEGLPVDALRRLTTVPSAQITAWSFGSRVALRKDIFVVDRPYGDGGSLLDDPTQAGSSSAQMYRVGTRNYRGTQASTRPANVRYIHEIGKRYTFAAQGAKMDTPPKPEAKRMGLTMMTYERERASNVHRWVVDTWGMVDAVALVWTGPEIAKAYDGAMHWVAELSPLGVDVTFQAIDGDFARARNAGIQALQSRGGLTYGVFFDPDEYLATPSLELAALRRMVEQERTLFWRVNAMNTTRSAAGGFASQSVRMFILREGYLMIGKVHESFAERITTCASQAPGQPVQADAPFTIYNPGLALSNEDFTKKSMRYAELLIAEVTERPQHANAWRGLYSHYKEGGWIEEAKAALAIACKVARPQEFMPQIIAGRLGLEEGVAAFKAACEATPQDRWDTAGVREIYQYVSKIPLRAPGRFVGHDEAHPPFPWDLAEAVHNGEMDERLSDLVMA